MTEELLTYANHSLNNAPCVAARCFAGFHAAARGELRMRLAPLSGIAEDRVVPIEQVAPLLDGWQEDTDQEPLGLAAALATPRNSFPTLEQVCRTAPTTLDMLESVAAATRLYHDGAAYTVCEEADGYTLRIGFAGEVPAIVYDFALGTAVRAVRAWAGLSRREHRVSLAAPRPVHAAEYERFFAPADLQFDAAHYALWVGREAAHRALPSGQPEVHRALRALLARALLAPLGGATNAAEQSAGERVRAVLKHDIRLRLEVTFDDVASRLAMAPRTLRRALQGEGISFGQLYAEERARAACVLLRSTRLPLSEVAARVGFTDVAPFVRAFKRWMQITPGAYRSSFANERGHNRPSQVVPRGADGESGKRSGTAG
jgi:AraC-like DNA-binding protein